MRAAMLLRAAGCRVRLFEARDRLGGRMRTEVEGDARYESGAEWIDADHERCLGLARELGIPLLEAPSGARRYHHGTSVCTADSVWPEALEDELRFESAVRELCRNLRVPPWANDAMQPHDHATLADFILQHAHSERGRWLLRAQSLSDEGDDPECIGLLGWLAGYLNYLQRQGHEMSAYRFEGGAERLFGAMAGAAGVEPELGRTLVRITQDPSGVTLEFEDGRERVEHAVLTLPPKCLERVIFEPALPREKRCALEASRMSRVVKVCLEFDRAWWLEEGWNGSMQCDLPIQQTWDGTRGGSPVLTLYVCGSEADRLRTSMNPVRQAFEALATLYPAAKSPFRRGWLHDWVADPFSFGGFSHLPPDFVLEHMRHLAPPQGRVHFAGEHTSLWVGFIEGALESAERVVQEIAHAS